MNDDVMFTIFVPELKNAGHGEWIAVLAFEELRQKLALQGREFFQSSSMGKTLAMDVLTRRYS